MIALGASSAFAMDFVLETRGAVKVIKAVGPIQSGDADKLKAIGSSATIGPYGLRAMLLSSPGGDVDEAVRISEQLQLLKFQTYVDGDCASACSMILYPAGKSFMLGDNGRLGFHPCSSRDRVELPECTRSIAELAAKNGLPYGSLEAFATITSPKGIFWVTNVLARCYGMERFVDEKLPTSYSQPCPSAYFRIMEGGYFKKEKILRTSFDCSSAKAPVEILLCKDEELTHLDSLMGALYQTMMLKRKGPDKGKLRQSQHDWIVKRDNDCSVGAADVESYAASREKARCVSGQIMVRLAELLKINGTPLLDLDAYFGKGSPG
jgi:uncharacterized protein YecT (DUF1311 family)